MSMSQHRGRRRITDEARSKPAASPRRQLTDTPALALVRRSDDIVVLGAAGNWVEVTRRLTSEATAALAEAPRAVVVDLSGAEGEVIESELGTLVELGRHPRDWPGTAFAVTSPDPHVRALLRRQPMSLFVHVAAGVDRAITAVSADDPVQRVSAVLEPRARAARAARDLVSRACLDWRLATAIPPACLLVSELVSNAVLHGGTSLQVSLVRFDRWLRIGVRDGNRTPPGVRGPDDVRLSGRGMLIVDKVAESWGHLPTGDGKVVWAVLAV